MYGRVLGVAVLMVGMLAGGVARAGLFADGTRYVFVALADQTRLAVLDSRDDAVAGYVELGVEPSQLETTGDSGRLLAVDGRTPRVSVAKMDDGSHVVVPLDFVPSRLAVAGDGRHAVAAAPETGRLAVLDVLAATVVARLSRAPFRDLTAAGDRLVLAPDRGLAVLDLVSLQPLAEVASSDAFGALARSPNSRLVYGRVATRPVVAAVDVRGAKLVGEVASAAPRAYTNAVGITLLLPEGGDTVQLVPSSLKGGVRLHGEADITGVYSGWFDTVAFLPSASARNVVVVDQQGRFRGDDIALGAVPGRGTVTPDGRKLYLPLPDARRVAVIDAERRDLAGYASVPGRPTIALMARTFGICH